MRHYFLSVAKHSRQAPRGIRTWILTLGTPDPTSNLKRDAMGGERRTLTMILVRRSEFGYEIRRPSHRCIAGARKVSTTPNPQR
jgi:hypothetical protein